MSGWAMLAAAAIIYLTAGLAIRWERARTVIAQPQPGPARPPPPSPLTPAEQAALAALATRHAHGNPRAGRMLADYLREKSPGISDLDLMRCVVALGHAARYFQRHAATGTDAFAELLHAMAGAALDLTELERNEIPR